MGYSLSWIAIRAPREKVLESLALRDTGAREEIAESPWVGAQLGDWYAVADDDCALVEGAQFAALSAGRELVSCVVEEHSMCSAAAGWREGKQVWSVEHSGDRGLNHLLFSGNLPEPFAKLREQALAELAASPRGPDFLFDVPIDLAKALTGFHHTDDRSFEILEPLNQAAKASSAPSAARTAAAGADAATANATTATAGAAAAPAGAAAPSAAARAASSARPPARSIGRTLVAGFLWLAIAAGLIATPLLIGLGADGWISSVVVLALAGALAFQSRHAPRVVASVVAVFSFTYGFILGAALRFLSGSIVLPVVGTVAMAALFIGSMLWLRRHDAR